MEERQRLKVWQSAHYRIMTAAISGQRCPVNLQRRFRTPTPAASRSGRAGASRGAGYRRKWRRAAARDVRDDAGGDAARVVRGGRGGGNQVRPLAADEKSPGFIAF